MNAERLNATMSKLLEAHKRYTERALEIYEKNIDAQLAAFTRATEKAEEELIKQLDGLTKQISQ
jgi:hypothetical protein